MIRFTISVHSGRRDNEYYPIDFERSVFVTEGLDTLPKGCFVNEGDKDKYLKIVIMKGYSDPLVESYTPKQIAEVTSSLVYDTILATPDN